MLSKNFKRSEFITDADFRILSKERSAEILTRIKDNLIPILQDLRDYFTSNVLHVKMKIRINCAFRNPEHNAEVGGKPFSHHLFHHDQSACDFTCEDMPSAWLWLKINRKRFCYAYWDKKKNFIHLSGLTKTDHLGRIGAMWIFENGDNIYE